MSQLPCTDPNEMRRSAELSELLGHVHSCWDNERRSLSRQLHDSLGSSLTALSMHLGMLSHKVPAEPALQERLTQMKTLLHQVVETNRQMQLTLWNDKLEFLGVRIALDEAAAEFGRRHRMQVRCQLPLEELDCPRSHGVVLLQALEEGLSNVARHASASALQLRIDDSAGAICLSLHDNGVGLQDGAAQAGKQYGLRLVRERAAYLGGSLTLGNHPDGGALLTVMLPKQQAAGSAA